MNGGSRRAVKRVTTVDRLQANMRGHTLFVEKARGFRRTTSGFSYVRARNQIVGFIGTLLSCPFHVCDFVTPPAPSLTRALVPPFLFLSKELPICADACDLQQLRRLWVIGAAGLLQAWPVSDLVFWQSFREQQNHAGVQTTRRRLGDAVAAYAGLLQRVCPGRRCCAWRNPRWFMNGSAVRPTLGGIHWSATVNTQRAGVRLAVAALCRHSAVHMASQFKTTPHSAMLLCFSSPTAKCRRRLRPFAEFDEDAAEQLLLH